jgi:hypothetical protein
MKSRRIQRTGNVTGKLEESSALDLGELGKYVPCKTDKEMGRQHEYFRR